MASPNIKDLLTAFSPRSEFFAISSGEGRIKVWDTLKGHLQTEFTDIISTEATTAFQPKRNERGHLSLDYKCMQWVQLGNKKKKKSGNMLLVLGTGRGDVLALDVSSCTLKWKVGDCHPGGVSSISFSKHGYVYTGGVDGIVCQIDSSSGNLIGKLKASTKAVSSLSLSADGSMFATAASQLKVFSCSDNKKIQKFSGHPVGVRCLVFSDDGKYVLSSGVGEKFVALWEINGRKKQPAACVLSLDHPPIFLTSKITKDFGFCVVTLSETGLCYFWRKSTLEDLKNSKPAKISVSIEKSISTRDHEIHSSLICAKVQGAISPSSVTVLFAYGSAVKPSFEKLSLEADIDVNLITRPSGVLLPAGHSFASQEERTMKTDATALDRANAEDAVMPTAKLYDSRDKKRKNIAQHSMDEHPIDSNYEAQHKGDDDDDYDYDDGVSLCLEDRLKSAGILRDEHFVLSSIGSVPGNDLHSLVGMNLPSKKVKSIVLSMSPPDASNFLEACLIMWRATSMREKLVLPWISCVLVNHGRFIASRGSSSLHLLSTLHKMAEAKCGALRSLLQLSGRLQLFSTQAGGGGNASQESSFDRVDESDVEDDGVDDVIYGEDDATSESGADDDEEMEER